LIVLALLLCSTLALKFRLSEGFFFLLSLQLLLPLLLLTLKLLLAKLLLSLELLLPELLLWVHLHLDIVIFGAKISPL
jgi:hypothetical protein